MPTEKKTTERYVDISFSREGALRVTCQNWQGDSCF